MSANRMDKINELIKNSLSEEINKMLPDKFVTVTQAQVSKDLSYAKIWVSALIDRENVVSYCRENSYLIKKKLSQKIKLKKVPSLNFVSDETETKASQIEELVDKIKDVD